MAPSNEVRGLLYHYEYVARVIGELVTGEPSMNAGAECWYTAFAPDESRFAWSCGYRKVVIIPWNRHKNCLLEDNPDTGGYEQVSERIGIDSGFPVCSLAFGTGTPEGELVQVQRGHWTRFDFTKDLVLATGHYNGRIRIWDPSNGKLLLDLLDRMGSITCLSFSTDGSLRLVSGSQDSSLKVWDITDDGNMFKKFKGHDFAVRCVAWSSNSKLLCSTGDKQKVFLWNMDDYSLKMQLTGGHYHDVLSCSFSPDAAMVATASRDTRVIIWDTESGEKLRILNHVNPSPGIIYMSGANNAAVRGVSFSPNGFHIVTVCLDGLLRFWNLTNDKDVPESVGYGLSNDTMLTCSYSPVGGVVAVGHESGCVRFFRSPNEVPSLLHLSRMSIRKSLGNVSYDPTLCIPYSLKPYLQYKQW